MKAKIIFENGGTIDIDLTTEQEKEIEKLQGKKNVTGYERVGEDEIYFTSDPGDINGIFKTTDENGDMDGLYYENADYYSDETVAKNNARADRLMRQLRRFAVENAEKELNWNNDKQNKYCIIYDYTLKKFNFKVNWEQRFFGIYFDSEETTLKAIDTYKDELLWYFTEYRDRV